MSDGRGRVVPSRRTSRGSTIDTAAVRAFEAMDEEGIVVAVD
jgi:hypothetical protein